MSKKLYQQVAQDRYDILNIRYKQFLHDLTDPTTEPVRVFDPLDKKLVDEIELIREVSKELQLKRDEDLKKSAQAASQAEEEAKKAAEEKKPEEDPEKK